MSDTLAAWLWTLPAIVALPIAVVYLLGNVDDLNGVVERRARIYIIGRIAVSVLFVYLLITITTVGVTTLVAPRSKSLRDLVLYLLLSVSWGVSLTVLVLYGNRRRLRKGVK
jgi:UDP-N-acetylmuramyl pentapeptide phosphotransferase/UDP-N-acetylglucosamine-1-phosphate transferase